MNKLDLLTEALGRTDPAERAAYLDQACTGYPDLSRRLEELLAGEVRSGSPLDRPPLAPVEHQPDEATATLAHADLDATTAMESGASTPRAAAVPTGEGIGTVTRQDRHPGGVVLAGPAAETASPAKTPCDDDRGSGALGTDRIAKEWKSRNRARIRRLPDASSTPKRTAEPAT